MVGRLCSYCSQVWCLSLKQKTLSCMHKLQLGKQAVLCFGQNVLLFQLVKAVAMVTIAQLDL